MFNSTRFPKQGIALIKKVPLLILFMVLSLLSGYPLNALANERNQKMPILRSIHNSTPDGYQQLGSTDLYYSIKHGGIDAGSVSIGSIDLIGKYGSQYYSSTYSDNGYVVAMKVGDNPAEFADCLDGTTIDGVIFSASIEPQGEMARIIYTLSNTNDIDKSVSVGAYDDAYVGDVISAAITKKLDLYGNPYGISLSDRAGAELCVLFGSGISGVVGADDYWFGSYYTNTSAEQMSGNYNGENDDNYLVENGNYDCGIGWCWKNRIIKANSQITLSYLIAIGDVNLEPNSSFEVTPDDPEGWNDLTRPHRLTLNGTYESPAGIAGFIEYSVEDSESWNTLTDTIASGEEFTASLVAMFNPERESHIINFRTVDAVGNTTRLTPIIYKDVYYHEISGIESKTYNYGDSIFQANLTCDLDESQYVVNDYHNNKNAGTATFKVQGVFPMTIGSRTYSFEIAPLPLEGTLEILSSNLIYTGELQYPDWQFTSDWNKTLIPDTDYTVTYSNNLYPGYGNVSVQGRGNYSGSMNADFYIDKAQLSANLYEYILPDNDICYDGENHPAYVRKSDGVGDVTITYLQSEDNSISENAPSSAGSYDIYVEFAEGPLYYGKSNEKIGSFSIYQFDENEWLALNALNSQLQECGWVTSWNLEAGPVAVSNFEGLDIRQGHVAGINFSEKGLSNIPTSIGVFSQLNSVDLSHNNLKGNAGLVASQLPNLTSLNLSYNQFSDLFPMISPEVSSLDISNQTIDKTLDFDIANLNFEQLVTQIPTIILYDHANQRYNTDLNFVCTTSEAADLNLDDSEQFALQLKYSTGILSMPYVSTNNTYHGESGDRMKVFALDDSNKSTGSNFHMRLYFEQGDANFTGTIDILDIQSIINYMFDEYVNRPFNFTAANLWVDESINIQDAVCGVNLLLEQPAAADESRNMAKSRFASQGSDDSFTSVASFTISDGLLILDSDVPIAAFDITIKSSNGVTINKELAQQGMIISQKKTDSAVRLIGYSLSGSTLPIHGFAICDAVSPDANIKAMLSDSEANEISWTFKSETNAISSISIDRLGESDIYTLDGYKVNVHNVMPGQIYIVKSNDTTIKTVITK